MKTLLTVFLTLIIIPISFAYDNTFEYPDKILNLIPDTQTITTTAEYTCNSYGISEIKTTKTKAITFHLGDGYFVALTHATKEKSIIEFDVGHSIVYIPIEIVSHKFTINGHKADLVGRKDDISLFKALDFPNQTTEYKLGDSDSLKFGDKVIVVGNSYMRGINIKKGIVSKIDMIDELNVAYPTNNTFMITNPTNPGDSGSAVLAKQDGEYYVVGIAHAVGGEGMGYAFEINYVKGTLREILKASTSNLIFLDHEDIIIIESWTKNP